MYSSLHISILGIHILALIFVPRGKIINYFDKRNLKELISNVSNQLEAWFRYFFDIKFDEIGKLETRQVSRLRFELRRRYNLS